MSRNFLGNLSLFIKTLFFKDPTFTPIHSPQLVVNTVLLTTGIGAHFAYTLSTTKTETIEIKEKYTMVRNGSTDFMLIDTKDRHFNVNNSLWFWKWDAAEEWSQLKGNTTITYYGIRQPVLGLFPNIVGSKRA